MGWLTPVMNFIGKRFLHFLMYVLLALLTIGVPYKLFVKDTNKITVQKGAVYNTCEKETPLLGCSMFRVKAKLVYQ